MGKLRLQRAVAAITHEGVAVGDLRGEAKLRVAAAKGKRPGALAFSKTGLEVVLSRPAEHVRLHLLAKPRAGYLVEAFDALGKQVAGEGGAAAGEDLRVTLRAEGIVRIVVTTNSGASLVDICLREDRRGIGSPAIRRNQGPAKAAAVAAAALPVVTGRIGAEG